MRGTISKSCGRRAPPDGDRVPKRRIVHKVPQSAGQMFGLVADVEAYPRFLPGCKDLKVLSSREADGKRLIVADMVVGYKMMTETFRSEVTIDEADKSIKVHYVRGPFRHLDNDWRFRDLPEGGSEIAFFIDFELKQRRLGLLVGGLFEHVFMRLIDAFESRARTVFPVV